MTSSNINRVVIIAAGRGSRLKEHTDECPKCLVPVNGRSIIDYQLEAYRKNKITDIRIVRGYLKERLVVDGATYYDNDNYANENILLSAMRAIRAFDAPLLTSYSDIIFSADTVRTLLDTPGDVVLTVDRQWAKTYVGRNLHPVTQAELTELDDNGNVLAVGKWVGPEHTVGEFIGLAKYTANGAKMIRDVWQDVRSKNQDNDPWRHAEMFRRSYLTDLIEESIERGLKVRPAFIDGGWREIDTVQDLERAQHLFGEKNQN